MNKKMSHKQIFTLSYFPIDPLIKKCLSAPDLFKLYSIVYKYSSKIINISNTFSILSLLPQYRRKTNQKT